MTFVGSFARFFLVLMILFSLETPKKMNTNKKEIVTMTSKGGSIGRKLVCSPRDPSSNPAWTILV